MQFGKVSIGMMMRGEQKQNASDCISEHDSTQHLCETQRSHWKIG